MAAAVGPPPNSNVAPEAAVHDPAHVPLHTPTFDTDKIPLLSVTVPVLLKVMASLTPPPLVLVPPVFSNVPALLKIGTVPPSNWSRLSFSWFHVAPLRL